MEDEDEDEEARFRRSGRDSCGAGGEPGAGGGVLVAPIVLLVRAAIGGPAACRLGGPQ